MTRRADPERIYEARRAALFRNLSAAGKVNELDAEHLIAAWERSPEAALMERLTPEFWEAAQLWIASVRLSGRT